MSLLFNAYRKKKYLFFPNMRMLGEGRFFSLLRNCIHKSIVFTYFHNVL